MDITKVLIYVYVIFFIGAGVNHFLNPQFYDAIVPQFIPFPRLVHQITGVLEIIIPLFLFALTLTYYFFLKNNPYRVNFEQLQFNSKQVYISEKLRVLALKEGSVFESKLNDDNNLRLGSSIIFNYLIF